jgi:hypothetical protein
MQAFAELLSGRSAMIVFVDERTEGEPRRPQRFFPIRTARILSPALTKGGMLTINFQLADYVSYENDEAVAKYDAVIQSLAARPRPNIDDCAYVSIGPTFAGRIQTESESAKDDDAWQSTIERIGRLDKLPSSPVANRYIPLRIDPFERAMFFRVVDLTEIGAKKAVPITNLLNGEAGYQVRGSRNYRLQLLFYHPKRPHQDVRHSFIRVALTSEVVHAIGATQIPLNFRYDRRYVDFITDRVFGDVWTSLSLQPVPPASAPSIPADEVVVTPAPTLLIRIKQTRWVSIVAPVAFAISTIIATLGPQFAKVFTTYFPGLATYTEPVAAAIAVLGSTSATLILFLIYGRLK